MPKTNIVELATEVEGTPGTAETLVQADVKFPIREGYTVSPDQEMIDLLEVKAVSSKTEAVPGRKSATIGASYILRGPGDLVTAPAVEEVWESALFTGTAAKTIAVGAITGTYIAGETITGAGAATGFLLMQASGADAVLAYIPISGVMGSAELITGGTSGATSTSAGAPADGGWGFQPADWTTGTGHHVTVELNRDDYYWQLRGALSDLQWEFTNGGPCIVTQTFNGAWSANGDKAMFDQSTFAEASVTVPTFLNVGLTVGTHSPTGVVDVTINWATNPTPVLDANDTAASGVLYADYARDLPTVTLEVDQIAVSGGYDWYTTMDTPTLIPFELTHGSGGSAGEKWTFSAPYAQVRSITPGDRDPNRATFQVELGLTGDNNDELIIWQH